MVWAGFVRSGPAGRPLCTLGGGARGGWVCVQAYWIFLLVLRARVAVLARRDRCHNEREVLDVWGPAY